MVFGWHLMVLLTLPEGIAWCIFYTKRQPMESAWQATCTAWQECQEALFLFPLGSPRVPPAPPYRIAPLAHWQPICEQFLGMQQNVQLKLSLMRTERPAWTGAQNIARNLVAVFHPSLLSPCEEASKTDNQQIYIIFWVSKSEKWKWQEAKVR